MDLPLQLFTAYCTSVGSNNESEEHHSGYYWLTFVCPSMDMPSTAKLAMLDNVAENITFTTASFTSVTYVRYEPDGICEEERPASSGVFTRMPMELRVAGM